MPFIIVIFVIIGNLRNMDKISTLHENLQFNNELLYSILYAIRFGSNASIRPSIEDNEDER
jgi:hypothetical protein